MIASGISKHLVPFHNILVHVHLPNMKQHAIFANHATVDVAYRLCQPTNSL
jgi:hypothetical protein